MYYMHTLNQAQINTICGGSYSEACYETYKKVVNDNHDFSTYLLMSADFGPTSAAAYDFGLKNAVKSICGDSFKETQAAYCANHPSTCLI
jgi:hypothetical protein